MISKTLSITASQTDATSGTIQLPTNWYSLIREIKVKIPTCTSDATFTFSIVDNDGDTRYTKAALAKNSVTILTDQRFLGNGYSLSILPSIATGTVIDVTIKINAEKINEG